MRECEKEINWEREGFAMTNIGKYPKWQLDAIEVVRQHQDGQMKYTNTEAVYKNRRWVAVTKPLTRDDWGKVFLKNMETVLLARPVIHWVIHYLTPA